MHNGERYLRVALDSILSQTLQSFELVICDNASTDGTEAICREYAARDPRVRYDRLSSNIGAANNFRRVFERSRGRYFKWVASDDYCASEFLERCTRVLDERPDVVLCTSKVNMVDKDGQIIQPYFERQDLPQKLPSERMIASRNQDSWCNAVYGVMRSEMLRRTAVMGSYVGSDGVLLAEISLYGCFAEVPEHLLFRRIHPGAYSWEVAPERFKEFYAPSQKRATMLVFRMWRHLLEYLRATGRAPLPTYEKARLVGYILRMAWWHRRELAVEIISAVRSRAVH